ASWIFKSWDNFNSTETLHKYRYDAWFQTQKKHFSSETMLFYYLQKAERKIILKNNFSLFTIINSTRDVYKISLHKYMLPFEKLLHSLKISSDFTNAMPGLCITAHSGISNKSKSHKFPKSFNFGYFLEEDTVVPFPNWYR